MVPKFVLTYAKGKILTVRLADESMGGFSTAFVSTVPLQWREALPYVGRAQLLAIEHQAATMAVENVVDQVANDERLPDGLELLWVSSADQQDLED